MTRRSASAALTALKNRICSGDRGSSGHSAEHILVAEPAGCLAKGQGLAPQSLEAHQRQLAPQGLTHDIASAAAGIGADGLQLLRQGLIEADGEKGLLNDCH